MKQKNNPTEQLAAIMNQLADSVLEMPDSQTSAETSDDGIDSAAEAEHTRNILREALNRYATNGPAKAIPPSLGERAAMTGYHAQYRVAASLILPLLATEELYAIRIADPAAGRVDDLVIKLKDRVRAYQMKWARYGGVLTFRDFTRSSTNQPALIAALADGWKRLKASHAPLRTTVTLVTNQIASVNDTVPGTSRDNTPRHFSAFLADAWARVSRGEGGTSQWDAALASLQEASRLSREEFAMFSQELELKFGHKLPTTEGDTVEESIRSSDLEALTRFLISTVADPADVVELGRSELLAGLGWSSRLDYRSRHEFPIDEALYEPIAQTVEQLESALDKLPGGYVGVLGSPGSGKSSLLTHTMRNRKERMVRYYAYVPDAQESLSLRGESVNFLHDVVLSLERQHFRTDTGLINFNRDQLLDRFHKQLQQLHEDWKSTGRRTIILIDGLDHIEREQSPDRSLLTDLPAPGQVPDGVLILLGSQTDRILLPSIQNHIRLDGRTIQLQPLSRDAVEAILTRQQLGLSLNAGERTRIVALSAGHPLALAYILNYLRTDSRPATEVLEHVPPYQGSIEALYFIYWSEIESDQAIVHLLALLARIRGALELEWIETWSDAPAFHRVKQTFAHYFRRETPKRWYFFHNSFLLYVLQRTSESAPGIPDEALDRRLHRRLAALCAEQPSSSPWSWDEIYHLVQADEHANVVARATPEYFRLQFFALRRLSAIEADLRLTLKSAYALRDVVALTRLVLAGAEVQQRIYGMEASFSVGDALLELKQFNLASLHIRDGNVLLASQEFALNACSRLNRFGFANEAAKVFALSEPAIDASGGMDIGEDLQGKQSDLLAEWAEAAVHFRSLREILDRIARVRADKDPRQQNTSTKVTSELHSRLLYKVGSALVGERRWDDVEIVLQQLETLSEPWTLLLLRDCWTVLHRENLEKSRSYLRRALGISLQVLPNWARLSLAEGALYVLNDTTTTKKLVEGIELKELEDTYLTSRDSGAWAIRAECRFLRLQYALGEERSPLRLFPDPQDSRDWGIVYTRRALAWIAYIWSSAARNKNKAPVDIRSTAFQILRLFNRSYGETRDWRSWYAIQSARSTIFELLIAAVGRHGDPAVHSLRQLFEAEWTTNEASWPLDARRRSVLAFFDLTGDLAWAKSGLLALESRLGSIPDVATRLEEHNLQITAWAELGDFEAGMNTLKQSLSRSLGIGYRKDYQLNDWLEWVDRMNAVSPATALARTMWYANAIASLEDSTEGKAARYAAYDLLGITFRWSPGTAVLLFDWFRKKGVIDHVRGLEKLIQAALNSDELSVRIAGIMLRHLLIPLSTESVAETCEAFLERIIALGEPGDCAHMTTILNESLKRYGFPETRSKNQAALVDVLKALNVTPEDAGLSSLQQIDLKEVHSSEQFRRADGTVLLGKQLLRQIGSKEEFFALLSEEGDDSYFEWGKVVTECSISFDAADVRRIVELRGSKLTAGLLESLTRCLLSLKENTAAWSLALKALNDSKPYGWDAIFGDGLRVKALECLLAIDPARAMPMAWDMLYRDLNEDFRFPTSIARNLLRIVPLLVEDPPIAELWPEIDSYVRSLFTPDVHANDDEVRLFDTGITVDAAASALVYLILYHLDSPCTSVSEASQRCLAEAIRFGAAQKVISALPEAMSERLSRRLLMVLESIATDAPEVVRPFEEYVDRHLTSRHFGIRCTSRAIWDRLGGTLSTVSPEQPLPSIYKLALRPLVGGHDVHPPSGNDPLPESDDAITVIRPWEPQVGLIASVADLPIANVVQRVFELMKEIEPRENWSSAYERELRSTLDSTHLRLPFQRPRVDVARRAIFHAVGELQDAGVLDSTDLRRLAIGLRSYDVGFVEKIPSTRPSVIKPMNGIESHGPKSKTWVHDVGSDLSKSFSTEVDGLVILAECSRLKHLSWQLPSELRCQTLAPVSSGRSFSGTEPNEIFGSVVRLTEKEYEFARDSQYLDALVLRNRDFGFESPGGEWCALSPILGRACGWHRGPGVFLWLDADDNVMVYSLWWVDGLIDYGAPHWTETGEGWLVLATQDALQRIESVAGGLVRLVAMERRFMGKEDTDDSENLPTHKEAFASFPYVKQ